MPDRGPDPRDPELSRPGDRGTTLEQFRQALARPVARINMGIHLSDEEARAVLADERLCARCYDAWLHAAEASAGSVTNPNVAQNATTQGAVEADEVRNLPVRFNRPPGWPDPPPEWVVEHLGRDISTYRRPVGAPPADLAGWVWWIPREPAWTDWIGARTRYYRRALSLLGFGVAAALGVALAAGGSVAVVSSVCAAVAGIWVAQLTMEFRRFRRDPMTDLREEHASTIARFTRDGNQPGVGWDWDGGDGDGDGD